MRIGALLGRNRAASACMDLSDGLADAVAQIAAASGTGAAIDAARCRSIPARARGSAAPARDPVARARGGGDDYELLFAVPRRARGRLRAVIREARGVPVTRIGELTADPAIGSSATGARNRCPPASSTSDRPMLRSAARPPLARPAAPHARHAAADGRRLRGRRVLRLLPVLGLHTVLGLVVAFAFNLNRVAVLLGVYSNLPWILPAYYTLATLLGATLLRRRRSARTAEGSARLAGGRVVGRVPEPRADA